MVGRILGLLSIPLMLFTIYKLIRQVNKESKQSLWSPLLNMIMAPVSLLINIVFLHQAVVESIGPLFLILGLGFGLAWGMTMRLNLRQGGVVGRQSILHLVFWGLSFTITQLLSTFAPATWISGGLVLMFFSTGTTLGSSLNLIVRLIALQTGAVGKRSWDTASPRLDVQPPTLPEFEQVVQSSTGLPKP